VRLSYRVYCRLTYQEPKQIASGTQPMSAVPVVGTIATGAEEGRIWVE